MILKKVIIFLCFLSLVCFWISIVTVEASETKKEEVENIIVSEQVAYSVLHGKQVTIFFSVIDGVDDDEYQISFEAKNIKTNNKNLEKIKKNEKYNFTFSTDLIGPEIVEIQIESTHYYGVVNIYIYGTDDYDYISTNSMNSSTRLYYEYLVANELATEEDYTDIVYAASTLSPDNTTSIFTTNYNTNYLYIRGYVYYTDNASGNVIPADGVKVVVYDIDLFGVPIALKTIYTNSSGYYTTTFLNDNGILENGYDILVKVFFGTSDFNIFDPLFAYSFEFDTYENAPNGLYLRQNVTFLNPQDNYERNSAMQIHQAMITGFKYLRYISDDDNFLVRVNFPSNTANLVGNSFYDFLSDAIDLTSATGLSQYIWDTVLHEYGHYVADIYYLSDFWIAEHSFYQHQTDEFGKIIGPELSWSEGWATYFSVVSQLMYAPSGILYVRDMKYKDSNIESDVGYLYGESNEWVIARFLFDIDDSSGASESWDNINYGGKELFLKLQDAVPFLSLLDTLSTFMAYLYENETDDFGPLLSYYYISAVPNSPAHNSVASFNAPSLDWYKGGGDPTVSTIQHYNNEFAIYIIAPNGNLLFFHDVDSATTYQLTIDEWNVVLTAGYDYVDWYVEASETTIPSTGPYISFTSRLYAPTCTNLYLNTPISDSLGVGEYEWYKFTVSQTGYYTFYTTGNSDTTGEFFIMPAANYTIVNRFDFDANSGIGDNFSRRLYLASGTIIYIRVRGDLYYSACSYTINATFTPNC